MHCQIQPADGETTYMLVDPCHSLTMHIASSTDNHYTLWELARLVLKIGEVVTYVATI